MKKQIKLMMKNKIMFIIICIMFLILTFSTFYLFYIIYLLNNIANDIRFLVNTILLFIWFILINMSSKVLIKNKKMKYVILLLFMLIYSVCLIFASITAHDLYNKISKISTDSTTYSSSLVTLSSNEINSIENIPMNEEIGILNDSNSLEGFTLPKEIIQKENISNPLIEYTDYVSLLNDLINGKINYIFMPTNYEIMFDSIEEIDTSNTKILYTYNKNVELESNNNEKISEPFTLLLMGVDSTSDNISNASINGDALMLITFNPNTLNATILSIPRDTYVPIACFSGNRKNKITHAAWYGEDCMQKTIENLMDIKIDYYVKINFKGVVNLVDALNGIEVDVPIEFCEQDSNRNFNNLICLKKGVQTLNGEQALALSRHRKTINDFIRGQNQQLVVKALMNKILKIRNLDSVNDILDTLKNNMETNMSTNQIFSFYDIALKILDASRTKETFNMQRLYISGYDKYIFDYSNLYNTGMRLNLYNFIPYEQSLKDVKTAMKINLELLEEETIRNINFDINKPFEEKVIGKDNYQKTNSINLLPNFVGKDKSLAISYANNNNIPIKIEEVTGNNLNFIGQVINQTPNSNIDTEYMNKNIGITIKVVTSIINDITNDTSENGTDNNQNITNDNQE